MLPKTRKCFYSEGLWIFKFWLKYLEIYGTEDDKKFLKQGKGNNFYNTFHYLEIIKKYPGFTDEEPMLLPSVSYLFARKYWKRYDIRYESRRCDLCETFFRLRWAMNFTAITQEQKAKNKTLLFDHQKSAHLTIFVSKEWSCFVTTKALRAE